jgi:hypothetical protein
MRYEFNTGELAMNWVRTIAEMVITWSIIANAVDSVAISIVHAVMGG